jgi:hypothetical protein
MDDKSEALNRGDLLDTIYVAIKKGFDKLQNKNVRARLKAMASKVTSMHG